MKNFIPLIQFYSIPSDDFYDKVHEKIIEYYLVEQPNESEIIKPRIATIIVNWIDRNDSNVLTINCKYKFTLIYSKSRDGFDYMAFHNKCNGKEPFIVLIKLQSKKIYGGYSPIGYALRRGQWLTSSDSFIFSFENDQDILNMKIDRVIDESYEGYFYNFGNHLYIWNQLLCLDNCG